MVATTKATKLNQMEGISIILHTEAYTHWRGSASCTLRPTHISAAIINNGVRCEYGVLYSLRHSAHVDKLVVLTVDQSMNENRTALYCIQCWGFESVMIRNSLPDPG
jgi:hypothetical protein